MDIPDVIGLIGVACYQVAYAGLQLGHFRNTDYRYIGLNVLAPLCLLFSLAFNFNLAAVIAQALWLGVTVLGLARIIHGRRRQTRV